MSISQKFDYIPEEIPQETAEEKQARENRLTIARYKANLAATDYIAIKIAEGAATADEYAEELAHRRYWRSEINRLEEDL